MVLGKYEPGETIDITVISTNDGVQAVSNIVNSLFADPAYFSISNQTSTTYSSLVVGAEASTVYRVEILSGLGNSKQVVTTTGELTADVLDVSVIAALAKDWSGMLTDLAISEGPQLIFRLIVFVLILFVFIHLSRAVQSLTKRALSSAKFNVTELLREMIVAAAKNLIMVLGILIALSQIGISLGPLLAGLGIAGFIYWFGNTGDCTQWKG